MTQETSVDVGAVARHPRVIAAVRAAMRAGHPVLALVGDIENLAPTEVRSAFDDLVAAVAEVTLEQLEGE